MKKLLMIALLATWLAALASPAALNAHRRTAEAQVAASQPIVPTEAGPSIADRVLPQTYGDWCNYVLVGYAIISLGLISALFVGSYRQRAQETRDTSRVDEPK